MSSSTGRYRQCNELSSIADKPIGRGAPGQLDNLLALGADPNIPPECAGKLATEVKSDWASQDPPPQFERYGEQRQPPLYVAARIITAPKGKDESSQMVTSLLRYGAKPFQEFTQALYHPPRWIHARSSFPGEDPPRKPDPEVRSDFDINDLNTWIPSDDSDDDESDEELPPQYGVRHVLHAIIEDGGYLKPFMDYPGFLDSLDVEHRDPQGRTLLLSACRSALGADSCADGVLNDAAWNVHIPGVNNDPFPKWDRDSDLAPRDSPRSETGTLIDVLIRLGAEPLAVDYQGKNALHHLLVEVCSNENSQFSNLPVVRRTLRTFATKYPSLVNQPDHHGTYPLHAALRRQRLHIRSNSFYINRAERQGCVREMLRAGANPRSKDRKGNTALHYLADDDLTGIWKSTETRQIFYDLLDKYGCIEDINLPNHAGKTIAELILDDDGHMETDKGACSGISRHDEGTDLHKWEDVDREVFSKLGQVGVDWMRRASDGSTLLHVVARSKLYEPRLIWRCQFLLQNGVDLKAKDTKGRTAREVAVESKNKWVSPVLYELEKDEIQR